MYFSKPLLLVILAAAVSAFADSPLDSTATSASSKANLIQRFDDLLSSHRFNLKRDLMGFHYETDNGGGLQDQSLDDISKWMLSKPSRFFSSNANEAMVAGPGLYLAVDPSVTRGFGGEMPELAVVKVKKDSQILDSSTLLKDSERDTINQLVSGFNCISPGAPSQIFDIGAAISTLRYSTDPQCQQIIMDALTQIKVQAILYNYDGAELKNCGSRYLALNVVDPSSIEVTAYFSKSLAIDNGNQAPFLRALYEEGAVTFRFRVESAQRGLSFSAAIDTSAASPSANDYELWKKQFIFGCGSSWGNVGSDSSSDLNSGIMALAHNYKETQDLIVNAALAYGKITPGTNRNTYFDFTSIQAILDLEFKASSLGVDSSKYSNWLAARKSVANGFNFSPDDFLKAGQLLEEQEPSGSNYNYSQMALAYIAKNPLPTPLPISYLKDMSRAVNLGSNLTHIIYDPWLVYSGVAPMDVSVDDFNKVLKKCIEVYSQPGQSMDALDSTDCRIVFSP